MNAQADLRLIIHRAAQLLSAISEDEAMKRPATSGRWSKKEILGHLVDSASNNHQRFVRAQLSEASELRFPSYDGDSWVSTQRYNDASWKDLVELWKWYNLHLAHIIEHTKSSTLGRQCIIGNDRPATLEFLITDYVRHLLHHLRQLLGEDFR